MIYSFNGCFDSPVNNPYSTSEFTTSYTHLSDEEIAKIIEVGETEQHQPQKIFGVSTDADVKASVSSIPFNGDMEWLYRKMDHLVNEINDNEFKYDLVGFHERFIYTRYSAPDGHFNWHVDIGELTEAPRKLSLVVQLSDPSEYEGGEFEVMTPRGPRKAPRRKGLAVVFSSFAIHRVLPITSGTRRVLTIFACGPNFR